MDGILEYILIRMHYMHTTKMTSRSNTPCLGVLLHGTPLSMHHMSFCPLKYY